MRKQQFVEAEFYHLYNRGNSKQVIFFDDQDRDRFLKLLYLCNSSKSMNFRDDIIARKIDAWDFDRGTTLVSIGAWVLLPNHFHLLVTTPISPKSSVGREGEEAAISKFMRKVCTSYVKYFNGKYKRNGGLFESNFHSNHVGEDEYLKYLFSYIHLNPVKLIDSKWKENGVKNIKITENFLKQYPWSSYADYIGVQRTEAKILKIADFPGYFTNPQTIKNEMFEWLSFPSIP